MGEFKRFTDVGSRLENRITVTRSQTFGFPRYFYKENHIDDYKYVVLYYDGDGRVGIHFTSDDDEEGKIAILKNKQGYGGSVIARNFFKLNNIDLDKAHGKFQWSKKDIDGITLFVINLKEKNG